MYSHTDANVLCEKIARIYTLTRLLVDYATLLNESRNDLRARQPRRADPFLYGGGRDVFFSPYKHSVDAFDFNPLTRESAVRFSSVVLNEVIFVQQGLRKLFHKCRSRNC